MSKTRNKNYIADDNLVVYFQEAINQNAYKN